MVASFSQIQSYLFLNFSVGYSNDGKILPLTKYFHMKNPTVNLDSINLTEFSAVLLLVEAFHYFVQA